MHSDQYHREHDSDAYHDLRNDIWRFSCEYGCNKQATELHVLSYRGKEWFRDGNFERLCKPCHGVADAIHKAFHSNGRSKKFVPDWPQMQLFAERPLNSEPVIFEGLIDNGSLADTFMTSHRNILMSDLYAMGYGELKTEQWGGGSIHKPKPGPAPWVVEYYLVTQQRTELARLHALGFMGNANQATNT